MTPLEKITARTMSGGNPDDSDVAKPLYTLEDFFVGNEVEGTIWCNLNPCPAPSAAYALLQDMRRRPEVADVRVQYNAFDMEDWPFSDTVWIITSASADEVRAWFPHSLAPDDCWEGWPDDVKLEECAVPAGMRPVACWWD